MLIDELTRSEKPIMELLDEKPINSNDRRFQKTNDEESSTSDSSKEKNKNNQSIDDYQKKVNELDSAIIHLFKGIEIFLFQCARGQVGIMTLKYLINIISLLITVRKSHQNLRLILKGADKLRYLGLYKRIFSFNRSFLLNTITADPIKKKGFSNMLNTK